MFKEVNIMTNKKRKDKITKEIIKETNKIINDLKTGKRKGYNDMESLIKSLNN